MELYIGVTNDLERRVYEHKVGLKKGFTQKHGINRFIYFEIFQSIEEAINREKNLKRWKRDWKINLIEEDNKRCSDLAQDWYDIFLID